MNQKQKQDALEVQKNEDQIEMMDNFLTLLEKPVGKAMISREKAAGLIKRRYFRQPKIYQNDYILEL